MRRVTGRVEMDALDGGHHPSSLRGPISRRCVLWRLQPQAIQLRPRAMTRSEGTTRQAKGGREFRKNSGQMQGLGGGGPGVENSSSAEADRSLKRIVTCRDQLLDLLAAEESRAEARASAPRSRGGHEVTYTLAPAQTSQPRRPAASPDRVHDPCMLSATRSRRRPDRVCLDEAYAAKCPPMVCGAALRRPTSKAVVGSGEVRRLRGRKLIVGMGIDASPTG